VIRSQPGGQSVNDGRLAIVDPVLNQSELPAFCRVTYGGFLQHLYTTTKRHSLTTYFHLS
jgi:hypothetical protein